MAQRVAPTGAGPDPAPRRSEPAPPAPAPEPAPRTRWRDRPPVRILAMFVALMAVCAPVVALHVSRSRPLFILDEFAYADYLQKVHDGQPFVRRGEITGQETLRELACRGYTPDSVWSVRPPCDAPSYDPAEFPNSGIDSADVHPPTYFILTDAGARVIMAVGVTDNLITAGRLFGAAWMAAGLVALWLLARALGANRWAAALALGLVAANPALRWQWHYLTPDAANILVGSLVVLAALRWERDGKGLAALAGAGALAMAFKAPNLMIVVAVAGYLLVRAGLARARRAKDADGAGDLTSLGGPGPYVKAAAALVGGAGAVVAAWLAIRAALAVPGVTSPMAESFAASGLTISQITENLGRFISPWDVSTARSYPFAVITSYILVGSLIAVVVAYRRDDHRHALAWVAGVVILFGPLLLVASNLVTTGAYFVIESRYGASLVPLQAALAAGLWRGRSALLAVAALVVTYNAAVLVLLFKQ